MSVAQARGSHFSLKVNFFKKVDYSSLLGHPMGLPLCGYSLVVKFQPSKLARRVRFPLPAPLLVNILQNDETPAVCAGALRKQHAKPFPELEEKYAELLPPRKVCVNPGALPAPVACTFSWRTLMTLILPVSRHRKRRVLKTSFQSISNLKFLFTTLVKTENGRFFR